MTNSCLYSLKCWNWTENKFKNDNGNTMQYICIVWAYTDVIFRRT